MIFEIVKWLTIAAAAVFCLAIFGLIVWAGTLFVYSLTHDCKEIDMEITEGEQQELNELSGEDLYNYPKYERKNVSKNTYKKNKKVW